MPSEPIQAATDSETSPWWRRVRWALLGLVLLWVAVGIRHLDEDRFAVLDGPLLGDGILIEA